MNEQTGSIDVRTRQNTESEVREASIEILDVIRWILGLD